MRDLQPDPNPERQRRRDATEMSVRSMLPALGLDELRVIELQIDKMLKARDKYGGELDLRSDGRDFAAEAAEEHRDAVFYLLVDELVRNDQRLARLHCEVADEQRARVEVGLAELDDATSNDVSTAPHPRFDVPGEDR